MGAQETSAYLTVVAVRTVPIKMTPALRQLSYRMESLSRHQPQLKKINF